MNPQKIICPVDLSDLNMKAVEYARMTAHLTKAKLIVVHALPNLTQCMGYQLPTTLSSRLLGEFTAGAESAMAKFIADNFPGIDARGVIAIGDPGEEVLHIASDEKADLIIMGTHGRKGMGRLLYGSVAGKIIRGADCPVLTVKPDITC